MIHPAFVPPNVYKRVKKAQKECELNKNAHKNTIISKKVQLFNIN